MIDDEFQSGNEPTDLNEVENDEYDSTKEQEVLGNDETISTEDESEISTALKYEIDRCSTCNIFKKSHDVIRSKHFIAMRNNRSRSMKRQENFQRMIFEKVVNARSTINEESVAVEEDYKIKSLVIFINYLLS